MFAGWTAEKILEKTGIERRAIVAANDCASDLAFRAAERLFADFDRSQVDFLLFCTQSPDYLLPTTACLLQHRLGLSTHVGALDFNLGCSGYIYGLALSHSLLQAGLARQILLLNADTYTRFIHPLDRSTRTIFGDGAAATLLGVDSPNRLHSFILGTDGRGAEQLMLRAGGARHRSAGNSVIGELGGPQSLFMNGPEVFNFTLQTVPELVAQILAKAGLQLADVDYFVFHQANAFMLEHLRRKIKIPPGRFEVSMRHCGNTVSATIPIALESALLAGRVQAGMRVLLVGFGVGLSWGGCILEWNGVRTN